MKLNHSKTALQSQKKEALIVLCAAETILLGRENSTLKKQIAEILKASAFKGEAGQTAMLPTFGQLDAKQIILTGIGKPETFHRALLERAVAAATRAGRSAGLKSFALADTAKIKGVPTADFQLLAGRGACWGTYEFNTFRSESKQKPAATLTFCGNDKQADSISAAMEQGSALLSTADIANSPGNEASPVKIANWTKAMAKEVGLTCEVLGETQLKKKGCGGILGVGQGSAQESQMIILKHASTRKDVQPIVLVGKTVTFDSGGISLKPGKGMGWMRYDKCGGMAVLTAMQMIARMKLDIPVVGILGAAENMPGSNAIKPGDIIKAYNGKTIEVLNTDAEGRLVLADALGLAAEMKPQAIVNAATLTGACIVALGSAAAAVIGRDPTVKELLKAGDKSGERLWQLPLWKDYSDDMKSDFADIANLSKSGGAGTATAAAFLSAFVPEEIPWAHLDIAGMAWEEGAKPWQAAGATLFGARLMVEWALAKQG